MQETLIRKLHDYIRENNPDLLVTLQEENRLDNYLRENVASVDGLIQQFISENRPPPIIEELCMEELTKPLKPSRFNYLKSVLEEEFKGDFERLQESGVLTTELVNLLTACDEVFDELEFSSANEDDRMLRYTVTGAIHEYLHQD